MTDSDTVEVTDNLDDFSNEFFGKTPVSDKVETEESEKVDETSEITPSATEGKESEESKDSDETDALEGEDETVEDEKEDKSLFKTRGRKTAKERIQELTRQREDERRRADDLARALDEARRVPKVEDKKTETAEDGSPSPDTLLEDGTAKYPLGEFDPNYIRDLTRFTIRQETEAVRKQEAEDQARKQTEVAEKALANSWTEKVKAVAEELPDLSTKAVDLEDTFRDLEPNYGQYLASTIMSLDYGPHVLDYLADHLDEAREIVASGPTRATIALGRLEAQIAFGKKSDKVEKGKVRTSAPPPPPTNRGSSSRNGVSPDTDDLDAFEKVFFTKK